MSPSRRKSLFAPCLMQVITLSIGVALKQSLRAKRCAEKRRAKKSRRDRRVEMGITARDGTVTCWLSLPYSIYSLILFIRNGKRCSPQEDALLSMPSTREASLLRGWLTLQPGRPKRTVSQQDGQPADVAGRVVQRMVGKGVSQGAGRGCLWHQVPHSGNQIGGHVLDRYNGESALLLTQNPRETSTIQRGETAT